MIAPSEEAIADMLQLKQALFTELQSSGEMTMREQLEVAVVLIVTTNHRLGTIEALLRSWADRPPNEAPASYRAAHDEVLAELTAAGYEL